jgi:hypothetical protein
MFLSGLINLLKPAPKPVIKTVRVMGRSIVIEPVGSDWTVTDHHNLVDPTTKKSLADCLQFVKDSVVPAYRQRFKTIR